MPDCERSRGDDWAGLLEKRGAWVVKLPSSILSGLPDWFVVEPGQGIRVVEAKLLQESGSAFVPSQCTRAQRFFLNAVARHGGDARVVVLGPETWYEAPVEHHVKRVTRKTFHLRAQEY